MDIARTRLESGLAQIEANNARKKKEKTKEREQRGMYREQDSHKIGPHSEEVAGDASEFNIPDIKANSKEAKEGRRLNRRKKATEAKLEKDKISKQKREAEETKRGGKAKAKKEKAHRERKERKKESSKLPHDINDHPEDINMLDNEATGQSAKGLGNSAASQISKPIKVTRIVPMKVGNSWVFKPVVDDPKPKSTEQEASSSSSRDNFLLTKKISRSSPAMDSDDNEFRRKRVKRDIDSDDIYTPTPASRAKRPGVGCGLQLDRSPDDTEHEIRDRNDGLRSPTPDNTTSTSSSSSRSGQYAKALKAIRSTHRERDDTPIAIREVTHYEDHEHVPDTWQDDSGKIRGCLETSEDTEVEESQIPACAIIPSPTSTACDLKYILIISLDLAFSSSYLSTHPKGVTISNVNFKIVNMPPSSQFAFGGAEDATLRVVSVAQGRVEVTVCGKVFSVQKDGMWRLRAREQCSVKNHGGDEAVMHVSSV